MHQKASRMRIGRYSIINYYKVQVMREDFYLRIYNLDFEHGFTSTIRF